MRQNVDHMWILKHLELIIELTVSLRRGIVGSMPAAISYEL